ncbi:hypothetical protein [Umezawaea tangerina]|uniref:Ornithine cyclodeaminase/alanine dehydrogenase-like protein (Mu-crystallin family) n=1 Tax=Umezawaea tangerina TaxID=84725 RepID=A0A2T0SQT6_9PSEU|nr:hypothetical protein [Umezawaea tangerina]PRY35769.1 ornithine cyclodeaminase/alanine dehydrogenase-like protein (mu-crystallin family) [Umezawaea tangerina]
MDGPMLRLSADDLCTAIAGVDPVPVLAAELMAARGDAGAVSGVRWGEARGEFAVLEDTATGERCALPAVALRAYRAAALTALAARQLLAPGVVTASVIGSGLAAQLQLMVIARHVPDVSHVAVCALTGDRGLPVSTRVVDQLDHAGIGLAVTTHVDEAVFGANLVAVTGFDADVMRIDHLAKGAVLVNATGNDLPEHLVDGANQVYVDDPALLDSAGHRHFARRRPSTEDTVCGARRHDGARRERGIESDLGTVLTGAHPGRTRLDHVLLVELLGTTALDLALASLVHRAALVLGLGGFVTEGPAAPPSTTTATRSES